MTAMTLYIVHTVHYISYIQYDVSVYKICAINDQLYAEKENGLNYESLTLLSEQLMSLRI